MIDWSVVVCCYNSEVRIKETLYRILSSIKDRKRGSIEIIIVDNLCVDRTVDYANEIAKENDFLFLKVVQENRPGLMYARIAGTMACSGKYIAFLDDDNWPAETYFNIAESVFDNHPDVDVFGCSTELPIGRNIPVAIQSYAQSFAIGRLPFQSGVLGLGRSVWGAGMALRTDKLKSVFGSGFSPILVGRAQDKQLSGDDSEIVHAMVIAGSLVWYEDSPLITHAVDPGRFISEKVTKHYEGIGAADLFIHKYSLSARRIPVHLSFVFFIFATRAFIKDVLTLFKYLLGSMRHGFKSLDFSLKAKYILAKWSCFLMNSEMRACQDKNIVELNSLRKMMGRNVA